MDRYTVDPRHSQLHVEIDHMAGAVSVLTIRFTNITGTWTWDKSAGLGSLVALLDARSLSSGLPGVKGLPGGDEILRGDKVWDVERFPDMAIAVPALPTGPVPSRVTGTLTMMDVTGQLDWQILSVRTGTNRRLNKEVTGIRLTGAVRRSDFGMDIATYTVLADEVRFALNLEAIID